MPHSLSGVELVAAVVVIASFVYLAAVVLSFFLPIIMEEGQNIAHAFSNVLEINFATAAERRRRRQIQQELDQELGRAKSWRDPEADILRAAQTAQTITALDRKLRKAVRVCHEMHWRLAAAIQLESMNAAATHPLAQSLRVRIIDVAEMLADDIDRYPLLEGAPELVTLAFGARRLASSCATCPYFACSVHEAPRPCPSLAAVSPTQPDHAVKDAEIVD